MISGSFVIQNVQTLPDKPAAGVLYVQAVHNFACHLCPCGVCGTTVWTPLGAAGWPLDSASKTASEPIYDRSPCLSEYKLAAGSFTELSAAEKTAAATKWATATKSQEATKG